jgi:hypothetical protein
MQSEQAAAAGIAVSFSHSWNMRLQYWEELLQRRYKSVSNGLKTSQWI